MTRAVSKGSPITLEAKFYEDGVLFDPYSVTTSVGIYNASAGGTLITTLTATKTATGTWSVTWSVPAGQTSGTYYDEWTWQALSTMTVATQRNAFTVGSNFTLVPNGNALTLENRLLVIETAINDLATALNNVPTKKQINAWQVLFQKSLNEIQQELDTHEAVGH